MKRKKEFISTLKVSAYLLKIWMINTKEILKKQRNINCQNYQINSPSGATLKVMTKKFSKMPPTLFSLNWTA